MTTVHPATALGSQPIGFLASVTTHPKVCAMKQAVSDAFEWLKQLGRNIAWAWGKLVDSGALHASLAIETASVFARAVLPDWAVGCGKNAFHHVRTWWLTIKGAIKEAELQTKITNLEDTNQQLVGANQALQQQLTEALTRNQVQVQTNSTAVTALTAQLQATQKREINAMATQVILQQKVDSLTTEGAAKDQEIARLKGLNCETERQLEKAQIGEQAAKRELTLTPGYQCIAEIITRVDKAKKEKSDLDGPYAELEEQLEGCITRCGEVMHVAGIDSALHAPLTKRMTLIVKAAFICAQPEST